MSLKALATLFGDTPLYIVGGATRNMILGVPHHDIDITAPLRAEEVISRLSGSDFSVAPSSLRLGTLIIRDGVDKYEYTAFRSDSYREGSGTHQPTAIKFTTDILEDARRRDFRANAVYYDVLRDEFVDPLGGIDDIKNRVLRTTREPEAVFGEDGLRLLRLVRFHAELGFRIDEECYAVAKSLVHLLKDISVERITEEFNKIMLSDTAPYGNKTGHIDGMNRLIDMGAMEYIVPELLDGKGVMQNPKYHKDDVLTHILGTYARSDASIRLAALLHDIAKPIEQAEHGNMYGHPVRGSKMARDIMLRLRYPNRQIDEVARLVATHMFDVDNMAKPNTVVRFILDNHDIMDKFLLLRRADMLAGNGNLDSYYTIKNIYDRMIDKGVPMTIRDLKVDGNDLMAKGIYGKAIGERLNTLLYLVAIGDIENSRTALLTHIRGKE